jgi:hypothetical protein
MPCPKCGCSNIANRTIGGSAAPLAKQAYVGGHPLVAAILGAVQAVKVGLNLTRDKYECRDCGHTFN